jgi:glutathione synthase/RimK-type ligase-like ATP-grasp enzyme
MEIVYCKKTRPTATLMKEMIPEILRDFKIIINLGNSSFNEHEDRYREYEIVNKIEAIKNSVDKKAMFKLFIKNKIPTVEFLDLSDPYDKRVAELYLEMGHKIILRSDKPKQFIRAAHRKYKKRLNNFTYATVQESKQAEYRVIVFKNKILRCMMKVPNDNASFRMKQHNCTFYGINKREFPVEALRMVKSAVKVLGLDLAGADLMLNDKNEWKVLEVNSGMGLNKRSITKLYTRIQKKYIDS